MYDERKHPRKPRGAPGGGQFAPKGALAATVGQTRFNPKKVETNLGADPLYSQMFERAHSVLVLFNPKTQELLFGIGVADYKNYSASVHYTHSGVLGSSMRQSGVGGKNIDERAVDEIDHWVRGTFISTGGKWRLEMNTSYAAGTRFDRASNKWEEHPDESMLNISDALATLRAQGFPKDMPVEIWKGVPGRRGSDFITTTLAEKSFDESAHPRVPAGSEHGGQFAPKGGGADAAGGYTSAIEFTNDSPVAERMRAGRGWSASLIFRPRTGALMADDRAEHLDLIQEDGGRTDEYVRGRALYAPAYGKWLFDFNFYYAGAPRFDKTNAAWETNHEAASANIAAALRRLVEAGFPLDSEVRIQHVSDSDVTHLTLGDMATKSIEGAYRMAQYWNFPLAGLLRKAFGNARYDESKHARRPKGAKGGGQFAPKGGINVPIATATSSPSNSKATETGVENEKFKRTPEDMLRDDETLQRIKNVVGDDPADIGNWTKHLSRSRNQEPGVYYRVEMDAGQGSGWGNGVGRGLYVGKDSKAIRHAYGLDGGTLETFSGFPKWLDLADYAAYDKFERAAVAKYGDLKDRDHLRKAAVAQGYDGIRYYDPEASGEEFVLYRTDRLKKTGSKKIKPLM